MKSNIEDRRVGDLKEVDELWPRNLTKIDGTNLARILDAIRAGEHLPEPDVDRRTSIVVDGRHRTKAYKHLFGPQHVIACNMLDCKDRHHILLEAARRNCRHGMPLDTKDKIDVILRLREMKFKLADICGALAMTPQAFDRYMKRTVRTWDKRTIAVPYGARHLCKIGKPITKNQEKELHRIGGVDVTRQARMLIAQIQAKAIDPENNNEVAVLIELRDLLSQVLP